MEWMKRALSMLLAVIMVISACPISAFATSSEEASDGDDLIVKADMSVSDSDMPEEDELEEDNAVYSYGDYQYTILADGSGGSSGSSGNYEFSHEATIAYLDIPVGVSSLKEFFNVNLHIINNSASEFSMVDNVIALNVPDGLTLVDSYISESNSTVTIAEIKGQTTETITWILRGDQVGEYYLSADYSGILSEFDEPIYTQFVATEPIEVFGLSNLKLKIEIPEELDHGTFYYNVTLRNEGKENVYRPRIDTGDTIIETQLFDAKGSNITDLLTPDAERMEELGIATSITGELDTLPAGYSFTRHYISVDQTSYTELEMKLKEYAYGVQNTYGLEIEIVTRPVSYFKSNLSANINAAEKADLTFTSNQSAYDYLMTNENYIYQYIRKERI